MRRSIRTRLIITFIGLAVTPLLIVGAFLAWQNFTVQQRQAVIFQHQVSARVATQVTSFIHELENNLQSVLQVRGLAGLGVAQQKELLSELLSFQHTSFENLALLNSQGQEIARVSRSGIITDADLRNRSQQDQFEFLVPMQSHQVYYSPIFIDNATGEPRMTVGLPILNARSGESDGVLEANISVKPVWDLLAQINDDPDNTTYIIDSMGTVIAHRDPSVVLKGSSLPVPKGEGIQNGLSQQNVVLAFEPITFGSQKFLVISEKPSSVALASGINAISLTVGLILIALVLAGTTGFFIVQRLVRPILELSKTARLIRLGNFSTLATVKSQDEIGQLAQAFNDMAGAIQKREMDMVAQADSLRVATAKAREAARLKSEFLANMSHELRTPLNAIIGFSDMLLMGMSGPLNDKQRHKMERLRENGTRLLSLINNVLDLTRIEARRVEIVQKPFSPETMINRLSAQMQVLAERSKLDFKTIVDPELPATVVGDEQRIEQVVVNLVSNAVKFTESGSVTVHVSAKRAENIWSIAVTDTGIGIPPHATELIFEEFRQLDGSSSRAYKGSGLGLAITRNLVRIMEGQITVQSELGRGSTFTATFPIVESLTVPSTVLETSIVGA